MLLWSYNLGAADGSDAPAGSAVGAGDDTIAQARGIFRFIFFRIFGRIN